MLFWIGLIAALVVGIYVGLGMPGLPGRIDRVVKPGQAKRAAKYRPLDYFKSRRR